MTAPALVTTLWTTGTWNPGGGLPTVTPQGITVADQPTLNALLAAAGAQGVELRLGVPGAGPGQSGPLDGQFLAWSSTLGRDVRVTPSGGLSEVASQINSTGVVTALSAAGGLGAVTTIPGTSIPVPDSNGLPVTLHYASAFTQTAVGLGSWYTSVQETTGAVTTKGSSTVLLPNSNAAPLATVTAAGEVPIGVVAGASRTFRLVGFLWAPAANNPAGNVLNSAAAPSWLRAVRG